MFCAVHLICVHVSYISIFIHTYGLACLRKLGEVFVAAAGALSPARGKLQGLCGIAFWEAQGSPSLASTGLVGWVGDGGSAVGEICRKSVLKMFGTISLL